ncbi:MAG: amino acid adenylation domain-containing protein [Cyanobacteria bacterium SID2]|nr:amino acid adenylation domain-containing protein [Cyanobacteria bacterium SID2]
MLCDFNSSPIHQLVELQSSRTPDTTAVLFQDDRLTYRELDRKANQLANYLRTLGVKPEVLVGVCVDRSIEMVVALLAILKAGGAYVPLDASHPKERLGLVIEDARMPILLTQKHLLPSLPEHQARVVCLDVDRLEIDRQSADNPNVDVTSNNLAYVMYTSGSTGKPKGVQIQHGSVANFLNSMRRCPGLVQQDVLLAVTTITFDISVLELFLPLVVGARVAIATREIAADGVQLSEALLRYNATVMQATPATWQLLLQSGWKGNQQLKILCGGESLPRELADRILEQCGSLWNVYGPTETTIWSTVCEVFPGEGFVPVGRPIDNTELYLLDDRLQLVPHGEIGELYIGGAGLARGYLNRPKLTAERFIPHPFSDRDGERLYRTGDLARFRNDGNLECLGRVDHQVKIRGFRIELGEIEALLWKYPDIHSAVVVAREDIPGDKRLAAYIKSDLVPERIPYQSAVKVNAHGNWSMKLTTDISKNGIGLVGVPTTWTASQPVSVELTLPGTSQAQILDGKVAWRHGEQAGIQFVLSPTQQVALQQAVDDLLDTQGLLKMLRRSLVSNLRDYLKTQLPDYMIPSNFVILNDFPLTPNGKVDRKALPTPDKLGGDWQDGRVAPQTAVEHELADIWQEVLALENIGIHDNFSELGGHSLLAIQLVGRVSETFDLELPLHCFLEAPTIAGLAQTLDTLHESATAATERADLDFVQIRLDPTIYPENTLTEPVPEIFLTGATGFLGTFLLYELLQQTRADVYCLVRAASREEAWEKIQRNLKRYQLWEDSLAVRIVPVLGDLSRPRLGLDAEQFSRFAEKIDAVYHCGAWVNVVYPYSALEAINVKGTEEVLRLASQTKIKPVHFISTVDVFATADSMEIRTVGERDAIGPIDRLYRGYAQSKCAAERLVMEASSRGLPVSIYRPSNVMGSSKTGINQTSGFIAKMLKGCIQMGYVPKLKAVLNLVPVDYASRSIVHLSRTQDPCGQAFHIVNLHSITWDKLVRWMGKLGYPLKSVSYEAWYAQLLQQASDYTSDNPLVPLVTVFANPDFIQKSLGAFDFQCENVLDGLATTSIECPPINDDLLDTYFHDFTQRQFFDRPPSDCEAMASSSTSSGTDTLRQHPRLAG